MQQDRDVPAPTTASKARPNVLMRFGRWTGRRPVCAALAAIGLAFVLLNVLAFIQARAMTHFVREGKRTALPDP